MKVIVAGSRTITHYPTVRNSINQVLRENQIKVSEIVSGHAGGVDKLGEEYAERNFIPLKVFPADWGKYKKQAGFIRNAEMAEYADALIAIWDGKSNGTKHMIKMAEKKNLETFIITLEGD